ncbi:MAG: hypothetical protein AAF488_13190, partial [Planctomycetota bacterium]
PQALAVGGFEFTGAGLAAVFRAPVTSATHKERRRPEGLSRKSWPSKKPRSLPTPLKDEVTGGRRARSSSSTAVGADLAQRYRFCSRERAISS